MRNAEVGKRKEDRVLKSEVGMRPPARRGNRGLRPGGKLEIIDFGIWIADCVGIGQSLAGKIVILVRGVKELGP